MSGKLVAGAGFEPAVRQLPDYEPSDREDGIKALAQALALPLQPILQFARFTQTKVVRSAKPSSMADMSGSISIIRDYAAGGVAADLR